MRTLRWHYLTLTAGFNWYNSRNSLSLGDRTSSPDLAPELVSGSRRQATPLQAQWPVITWRRQGQGVSQGPLTSAMLTLQGLWAVSAPEADEEGAGPSLGCQERKSPLTCIY